MSYLGEKTIYQKHYSSRYVPGIGDLPYCLGELPVVRHEYRCDACGYTALVIGKAEEPFFCWKCPNRLISIEPENQVANPPAG